MAQKSDQSHSRKHTLLYAKNDINIPIIYIVGLFVFGRIDEIQKKTKKKVNNNNNKEYFIISIFFFHQNNRFGTVIKIVV